MTVPMLAALACLAVPMVVASPASAASCSKLRENQYLSLTFSWRYTREQTMFDSGVFRRKTLVNESRTFGQMRLAGATCKDHGRWRVVKPFAASWSSVGLSADGDVKSSGRRRGWGIGIRSGNFGTKPILNVQTMHCGKGNFFSTLKTLTSVPIPKLHPMAAVGLWIGGMFLPKDKQTCGDVGVMGIRVSASRSGRLQARGVNRACCGEELYIPGTTTNPWNTLEKYSVKPVRVKRVKGPR